MGLQAVWPERRQLLSVVVPVYNEEGNVPEFLRVLTPILEATGLDYEIIFALDPSPDRTEEVVRQERQTNPRVKLIKFSRRFGQPMADDPELAQMLQPLDAEEIEHQLTA